MAQKSQLTVEEFEQKLREVMDFIYDIYLPSDGYAQIMIGSALRHAFCEENKQSISEITIILMAIQIICKRYGFVYWYMVDNWVNRFKNVVLEHLLEKK